MSQRLLVQSALRGAQGIEHKNRNIDLKALAILSYITTAAIKFRLARAELRSIRAREEREVEAHRLLQEQHIREAEEHTARMGLY